MQVVQADVTTSDGFSCRRDDSLPINPGQKHGAPGERQKPSLLGLINSGCPEDEDVCFNERGEISVFSALWFPWLGLTFLGFKCHYKSLD